MSAATARGIAEAYRWQRRLGNAVHSLPCCGIVTNTACPDVWDANHIDAVTAERPQDIAAVFAALDSGFPHTPFRVVHTDAFTPDAFLAELAFREFAERPVIIQMARDTATSGDAAKLDLRPVTEEADWAALLALVAIDFAEGRRTNDMKLSAAFCAEMVASYRAKTPAYRFALAWIEGRPAAYCGYAAAPNGFGLIEDLFTLPAARGRGVASAMIAHGLQDLGRAGSEAVFIGALANETPKRLYARLGFRPLTLSRTWVREIV